MDVLERIGLFGVVPVIKIEDPDDAVPVCEALLKAGLSVAEITFRTDAAEESIRRVVQALPEMLVGAGTVTTEEQARRALDAGACFMVSAGLNDDVVLWCKANRMPIVPGVSSPSEVELAMRLGLDCVKFFPAEVSGGVKMLKQLHGPYSNMKFMPTGGISPDNLNAYLALDYVLACGGSWLVPADALKDKNYGRITEIARKTIGLMLDLKLAHVGIHPLEGCRAEQTAQTLADLLDGELVKGSSSCFVDGTAEICMENKLGTPGHLAYWTNSVERTVYYLQQRGFAFDPVSFRFDPHGKQKLAYLTDPIGGYSVHFIPRTSSM